MRFTNRRLLSLFYNFWPCKVLILLLLICQILYLTDFLRIIVKNKTKCLNLRKFDTNLQRYPIHLEQSVPALRSEPLNWIQFDYKLEPKCLGNVKAVVIVHTKAENFAQRPHFRRNIFQQETRLIFVLFNNPTHWNQLEAESKQFEDLLVVGGILDHYHNITHKARAWIIWLNDNCNHINVVLKVDDDVHVKVSALPSLLRIFDSQKSLVLCRVFRDGQVVRNSKSKWFLDKKEYEPSSLGTYCQGMAFAFSTNLLQKMVKNMNFVQFLWMDDWYVTHALLNGTQATYRDIGRHFISTNRREELDSILRHNSTLRYEPLFGHFRPNGGLNTGIDHWRQIQQLLC